MCQKLKSIKPISDLFDEKYLDLNYIELLKECNAVELHLSDTDIRLIEKDTIYQARENSFYRHRAGRIGESRSRAASHTDLSQPSQSLIKAICYPNVFRFSTAATRHGCNHEEPAILKYEKQMKMRHRNFKNSKVGQL